MKITYSPAGSQNSYIIEGTEAELASVIDRIVANKQVTPAVTKSNTDQTSIKPVNDADMLKRFLDSVYLYPADPKTDTGKGRFIANILADMKPHTYSELERKANSLTKTINNNIAKLRNAGAIIEVNGATIQLVSFPQKKAYIKKRRSAAKSINKTKSIKNKPVIQSLSGLKLS